VDLLVERYNAVFASESVQDKPASSRKSGGRGDYVGIPERTAESEYGGVSKAAEGV
jgi:hypothetical protein